MRDRSISMPRARDEFDGGVEHGERLQAEEVELHQPRLLHPFHVELGDRHVGFRIAVERRQLAQRPVADHDAGGMGGGVARQAFQLLGDVEGAPHHRIGVGAPPAAAARRRWRAPASPGLAGFCGTSLQSLSTWP